MQRHLHLSLLHILEPSWVFYSVTRVSLSLLVSPLSCTGSWMQGAAAAWCSRAGAAWHSTSPRNVTLHCAHTRRGNYQHFACSSTNKFIIIRLACTILTINLALIEILFATFVMFFSAVQLSGSKFHSSLSFERPMLLHRWWTLNKCRFHTFTCTSTRTSGGSTHLQAQIQG